MQPLVASTVSLHRPCISISISPSAQAASLSRTHSSTTCAATLRTAASSCCRCEQPSSSGGSVLHSMLSSLPHPSRQHLPRMAPAPGMPHSCLSRSCRPCSTRAVNSEQAAVAAQGSTSRETDGPSGSDQGEQGDVSNGYSPLHHNIQSFCRGISPTEEEHRTREALIEGVRQAVAGTFTEGKRNVHTEVFGSYVNGLATWQSDIDLVVTGLHKPHPVKGGYEPSERSTVASKLRRILNQVRKDGLVKIERVEIIPKARIPIIRLHTRAGVTADVSISDDYGVHAAKFLAEQVRVQPALRPLALVLKAFLKQRGLNEAATGGLSSYSLCNMVLAHIQEELKSGADVSDLGELLYTFLLRYGEEFDYQRDAVSVVSGGIVPKRSIKFTGDGIMPRDPQRLAVECPLSGRDVSGGSFNIHEVQDAFYDAARALESLARKHTGKPTELKTNYLSALFNVNKVLARPKPKTRDTKPSKPPKTKGAASKKQQQVPDPMGPGVAGMAAVAGVGAGVARWPGDDSDDGEIEVLELSLEESQDPTGFDSF